MAARAIHRNLGTWLSLTILWKSRKHRASQKVLNLLRRAKGWIPVVGDQAHHDARQAGKQNAKEHEEKASTLGLERHGCRFRDQYVRNALTVQGVRNAGFFLLAEIK